MVKFRGIEICIVSQFDIRRLPEFAHRTSPVGEFNASSATCYVPVYPGCQIWFEYTIDGPHPPNAAYFFKLFINNHSITSWDCTAKFGYHGKTSYCLQASNQLGCDIERRGFRFSNVEEEGNEKKALSLQDDCIEIRVYRIEHRQRIRGSFSIPEETLTSHEAGNLGLVNSGPTEPGRPHRRYKYQLLDPLDTPHAKFRFFYRDYEWLESHGLINTNPPTDDSVDSSVLWYDPTQGEVLESSPSGHGSPNYTHPWVMTPTPEQSPRHIDTSTLSPFAAPKHASPLKYTTFPSSSNISPCADRQRKATQDSHTALNNLLQSVSEDSLNLSLLTKGSIEDLHSSVPRSPQSLQANRAFTCDRELPDLPVSPHKSPRRKKLAYEADEHGVLETNDPGPERRRPLSPFTSSGFLRCIRSLTPPSAPECIEQVSAEALVTEEGDPPRAVTPTERIIRYLCRQAKKSPVSKRE